MNRTLHDNSASCRQEEVGELAGARVSELELAAGRVTSVDGIANRCAVVVCSLMSIESRCPCLPACCFLPCQPGQWQRLTIVSTSLSACLLPVRLPLLYCTALLHHQQTTAGCHWDWARGVVDCWPVTVTRATPAAAVDSVRVEWSRAFACRRHPEGRLSYSVQWKYFSSFRPESIVHWLINDQARLDPSRTEVLIRVHVVAVYVGEQSRSR